MASTPGPPRWLSKVIIKLSIGLVVGVLILAIFVYLGATDPKKPGILRYEAAFADLEAWRIEPSMSASSVRIDRQNVSIQGLRTNIYVVAPYIVRPPASIELSIRQIGGSQMVESGIWWQPITADTKALVEIKADRYIRYIQIRDGEINQLVNWHEFPHVRGITRSNQLRLDISAPGLVVRINDEIAVVDEVGSPAEIRFGLVFRTDDLAKFEIRSLEIFDTP